MKPFGKILLGALVLALVVTALYYVPMRQVRADKDGTESSQRLTLAERADLENKFRGTLTSGLGGVVLLLGLWFTLQQVRLSGRNAAATEENVRVSARSKNLDRITAATEFEVDPIFGTTG